MKGFNFCVYENKVFDLNGFEIVPDSENIVNVFFNGANRRFKVDKMIVWLKESGYNKLFRKPKIVKIPKVKPIKETIFKAKKTKAIKISKPKKEKVIKPKIIREKKEPKKYQKVEFDKRTLGNENGYPKRKIKCNNGKVYNSLYEASKELNLSRGSVYHVCNGKYKHTKGFTFKYFENENFKSRNQNSTLSIANCRC